MGGWMTRYWNCKKEKTQFNFRKTKICDANFRKAKVQQVECFEIQN
jgi:hypothetical protein